MASNEPRDLLNFVANVAGDKYLRVEEDLGEGYVQLRVSEAERRQAKHDIRSTEDILIELLRNSRDASSKNVFVASHKDATQHRKLIVIDDGWGIPSKIHQRLFEPRITAKLDSVIEDSFGIHGRGMALYSIKSVVEDAKLMYSAPDRGTVFKVIIDTNKLPEKKDQSTFPKVFQQTNQTPEIKGLKNIPRILVEFALQNPNLMIYFGSDAEILAVMRKLSLSSESLGTWPEISHLMETKGLRLWQLSGLTHDGRMLSHLVETYYGLEISERNIYRVLAGEIVAADRVTAELPERGLPKEKISDNIYKVENIGRYITGEDLELLKERIKHSFGDIGNKYFIKLQTEPEVRRERNQLKISLTLVREEEN